MKVHFGVAHALIIVATTAVSFSAFAQNYGSAGCGLGSLVIGPGEGFSQVSAATTNGTGYQSFAITSGTSNCKTQAQAAALEQQESFMMNNYAVLSKEMAQGNGDTLAGLTATLGCEPEVQPLVASHLQKSYDRIFSQPGALAALDATRRALQSHPEAAQGCRKLSI